MPRRVSSRSTVSTTRGVTAYSLQSHLRTTIPEGQVETDEVYVGVDKLGAHYVFPVQAKGGSDRLSVVQIWQDFKMCAAKFPWSIARPIAAQFMPGETIAMFSFEWDGGDRITIAPGGERHNKLVAADDLTDAELAGPTRSGRWRGGSGRPTLLISSSTTPSPSPRTSKPGRPSLPRCPG